MFFLRDIVSNALVYCLVVSFVAATYDPLGRSNVATYYGQGPNQKDLLTFCQKSSIDLIPIGFVTAFPPQANGYLATNFGNRCSGQVYSGPGYNGVVNHNQDGLLSNCPELQSHISACQTLGKKILLSLGGDSSSYQLNNVADGQNLADFLWGAYGPVNQTWINQGKPRPFGDATVLDGFDFDIEHTSPNNQAGYIACIQRLRNYFSTAGKQFLITGAPQCVIPDANMAAMIAAVKFDIIWVQFYNTPYCSARAWVNTGGGFSYDGWANFLVGTQSANAKLYIGLPGSTLAAGDPSNYLNPTEAGSLLKAFFCHANFGGVMLWEATYADNNVVGGLTYDQIIKKLLLADSTDSSLSCAKNTISTITIKSTTTIKVISTTRITTTSVSSTSKSTAKLSTTTSVHSTLISTSKSTTTTISSISSKSSSSIKATSSLVTVTLKTSTSSSQRANASPTLRVSTDGSCGSGTRCASGSCCSKFGFCGSGPPWCGPGCQPAFGVCS